jgi:hypothetical protein
MDNGKMTKVIQQKVMKQRTENVMHSSKIGRKNQTAGSGTEPVILYIELLNQIKPVVYKFNYISPNLQNL